MTYIKLLTVLAGLALLTACGGGTAETPANNNGGEMPDNDKTDEMPDNDKTGGVNTTDCTQTPFHDDCLMNNANALTLRQTMCFASVTANPTCGAVIMGACVANPFRAETACMADTYLPNRIAECITGGNAGEEKCETLLSDTDMNTALTDCLTNPFDVACESVTAFTTYALARTNRASFCDNSDNVADDLCTGDVVMPICGTNPFNAICFTDDTYLPNRIAECITDGNAGEAKCETLLSDTDMNTALTDCLTNPFDVACESVTAFTTYALARTNRASFCDNSDNVADDLCTGDVVMPICGLDPFNAICFTDDTYLSPRITDCIMAGNAGEEKCETLLSDTAMNTELTDCLENPFATACESVDGFTTFALARTNRLTFCDDTDNVANGLCTGENLMNVCVFDPFNAICFTDKTYLTARFNNCITGGNAGDMKCDTIVSDNTMNAEITACLTNPFTDACASNPDFDDYADMARANRVAFCESGSGELCTPLTTCNGNPFHESCGAYFAPAKIPHCAIRTNAGGDCATTLSNPNAATWAHSFATALSATPTTENQFLLGMATGIGTGDVTNIRINETLNLETATYKDVPLGGDAEDGVAYFSGQSGGSTYYNYAGIFSGTNLGAPITGTTGQTATWNGEFRAFGSVAIPNRDFSLTVTFDAGGTSGTLDAFIKFTGSTHHYKLDGVFNDKGVISGTVVLGNFTGNDKEMLVDNSDKTPGTLTGLIGQEGAVGAFHSNNDSIGILPYVGGFVAGNPALVVNHADWLGSFSPAPPATRTTGTGTFGGFLNLADGVRTISNAGLTALNSNPHLTLDGNGMNGMHGVTYRAGKKGTNNQAFVAVLPTTNLGAPLIAQPTIGTWPGTYYNRDFANTRGIDFDIDFDANTIDAVHEATSPFALTTTFDLDFTPATGVITGTVTAGAGAGTATARGLIGTNGLVGVFVDTAPTGSIVLYGGFIADNPNN